MPVHHGHQNATGVLKVLPLPRDAVLHLDPMEEVVAQPVAYQQERLEDFNWPSVHTTHDHANPLGVLLATLFEVQPVEVVCELTIREVAVPEMRKRSIVRIHVQAPDLLKRQGDLQQDGRLGLCAAHGPLEGGPQERELANGKPFVVVQIRITRDSLGEIL